MRPPIVSVLPALPPRVYARSSRGRLPFPLEEPSSRVFSCGRHCLWQGLKALDLGAGAEALVPAYHHGSEIEALVKAGVTCRFYEATETLEPDADELETLITPRTRALVLIHYSGFPQDVQRWRAWCDERELFLIEDAAQSWLASTNGRPLGSFGDIAIFCLYKTFGLPDGASLVLRAPAPPARRFRGLGTGRLLRRHARWGVMRSSLLAELGTRLERPQSYDPEDDFKLGDPASPPCLTTRLLLPRVAEADAARRRRENYRHLLEKLPGRPPRPFDHVPEGASPHAFPVRTDRPDELVERLAESGVRAFRFWSYAHPELPAERFPAAASRRGGTVVLPVHQELRPGDLDRIADATAAAGA